MKKYKDSALVVVDMLYDFIDGSLACEGAEAAVAALKGHMDELCAGEIDEDAILGAYPVIFIADHHPADHSSFKEFGGIWPIHCVAGTRGGDIHEDLQQYVSDELTFYKGCDKACEQYSGFEGVNLAGQSLSEVLGLLEIKTVLVAGIATEYCVKNTVLDLHKAGFKVVVLEDSLAWVDRQGHEATLAELKTLNIEVI